MAPMGDAYREPGRRSDDDEEVAATAAGFRDTLPARRPTVTRMLAALIAATLVAGRMYVFFFDKHDEASNVPLVAAAVTGAFVALFGVLAALYSERMAAWANVRHARKVAEGMAKLEDAAASAPKVRVELEPAPAQAPREEEEISSNLEEERSKREA